MFDNSAKYLFKLGDVKGEGKMSHPRGLLTVLGLYRQMNTIMIFISVIITTIEFKSSLKTFNSSLSLVKILFTTLVTLNTTKTISLS